VTKDQIKEYNHSRYWANPEHYKAVSRANYAKDPEAHKARIKRNYIPVKPKVQVTDPALFIHDFKSLWKACQFFDLPYLIYKKYPIRYKGFKFEKLC